MKISVIICTYNRYESLKKAIQSTIDQTERDWELIVVNGSNDSLTNTMLTTMYDSKAIKYVINHKDRIYARNIGLSLAEGDYVVFFDDDDISINTRLEKQAKFLDEHLDVDVVSCTTLFDNKSGLMHTLKMLNHNEIMELINDSDIDHICNFQSCMFRKSTIDKIFDKEKYFYDEYIGGGEGQAFLYTLLFNGCRFANINDTVCVYNLGKAHNSLSKTVIPIYYNETLLDKTMQEKHNIIKFLYNKLKGLLNDKNDEEVSNVEVTEEVPNMEVKEEVSNVEVKEEVPTEKPKRTRAKKTVKVETTEEVPTEKPKRTRAKKTVKVETTEEVPTEKPKRTRAKKTV
jgi:glycosyltransferase involved in cell wall biosynthesis